MAWWDGSVDYVGRLLAAQQPAQQQDVVGRLLAAQQPAQQQDVVSGLLGGAPPPLGPVDWLGGGLPRRIDDWWLTPVESIGPSLPTFPGMTGPGAGGDGMVAAAVSRARRSLMPPQSSPIIPSPAPGRGLPAPSGGLPMNDGGGGGSALERAIDAATADPRLRQAMRLAAMLEGGNLDGDWGVGDQGQSFGPYQIYTRVHNVTRQQAEDPVFATRYMLPEYQRALAKVDASLWQTDPRRAAALTAFYAERPAVMYDQARVASGWDAVQLRGQAAQSPAPSPQPPAPSPQPLPGATGWDWLGGRRFAITGEFGQQDGPYPGSGHRGMDIAAPMGTALTAPVGGTVLLAGAIGGGYGNAVLLRTADGRRVLLGHLASVAVRPGQAVTAGTALGQTGNSGKSTGAHLHFEVQEADGTPVDPRRAYTF